MGNTSRDCCCHTEERILSSMWSKLSPAEQHAAWIWEVCIEEPESEPLGDCLMYRAFEFEPIEPGMTVDYDRIKDQFLQMYNKSTGSYMISAELTEFHRETNYVLADICQTPCPTFLGLKSSLMTHRSCYHDFTEGFYAAFELDEKDLSGKTNRRRRSDAKDCNMYKSILVHDLRLLGHPVTVELKFAYHQKSGQSEKLQSLSYLYPGSRGNQTRYSKRLGIAVTNALLHNMSPTIIAEATAIPRNSIFHWRDKEIYQAAKGRHQIIMRYMLTDFEDYSASAVHRSFNIINDCNNLYNFAPGYKKAYTFVFRSKDGNDSRLVSIYPKSDWYMIKKMAEGTYEMIPKHIRCYFGMKRGMSYSATRLFNLAMDYLSVSWHWEQNCASPILGAMLFLASYLDDSPQGQKLFSELGDDSSEFYENCYQSLRMLFSEYTSPEEFEESTCGFSSLLSALMYGDTADANYSGFEYAIIQWRKRCEELERETGIHMPRCRPKVQPDRKTGEQLQQHWSEHRYDNDPSHPSELRFPMESGVESMNELITRLLLFNPATMSSPLRHSDISADYQQPEEEKQDDTSFTCVLREDGTLDYENIIPGIELRRLYDFLKQGFLLKEQKSLLQKNDLSQYNEYPNFYRF